MAGRARLRPRFACSRCPTRSTRRSRPTRARCGGADLILACGDLPFEYLGSLMNALDVPLVFVPGNHDPDLSGYRSSRAGLTLRAGHAGPDAVAGRRGERRRARRRRGRPAGGRARRVPALPRRPQPVHRPAAGPPRPGAAGRGPVAQAARRPRGRRADHPCPAARRRRRRRSAAPRVHRAAPADRGAIRPAVLLHGHVHPYGAPRPAPTGLGAPWCATSPGGTCSRSTARRRRRPRMSARRASPRPSRCPLTPASLAPTSRTTSSAPAAARCWPGSPSGCAAGRTTSTSSCRSTRSSPPWGCAASGGSACRPSGWTRSSAPSTPAVTSTAGSGPPAGGCGNGGSGSRSPSGAASRSRRSRCTASATCTS